VLDSDVDAIESILDGKCSQIDANTSRLDALSGLDNVTSVLDAKCSQIDMNTSLIDVNITMIDMLKTATVFLQSEIDAISGLDDLTSLVDVVTSCCDLIREIGSQVDVNTTMIDMLKTSTGQLQSEIDAISGLDDLTSLIDTINSCCELIQEIESQVDVNTTMIDRLKKAVCLIEYKLEQCCVKPPVLIPGSYSRKKHQDDDVDEIDTRLTAAAISLVQPRSGSFL